MALDEYGLTPKRRRFADYYLENPSNQAEAYRKAGYAGSDSTCCVEACRLLKNPNVHAYISMRQKEISERTSVTVEYIIEKAKKVLEQSLKEVPVMEWDYEEKCKRPTGEFTFDSKGANGALKILGDTIGAFKEKKTIEHDIAKSSPLLDIMNQLSAAPPEDLEEDDEEDE